MGRDYRARRRVWQSCRSDIGHITPFTFPNGIDCAVSDSIGKTSLDTMIFRGQDYRCGQGVGATVASEYEAILAVVAVVDLHIVSKHR